MLELSPQIILILMFGGLVVVVMTGFPLGLGIAGVALLVGYLSLGNSALQILYQRVYALAQNYSLAAMPLFLFMGAMFQYSGIASQLYDAMYQWLSGLKGGLAVITILVGTILAACVGVISASVSMLTLVALPSMIKRGYDKGLATGACALGGTLGILIPPSVMLVVYGPMAQVSVGKLFMGAFFPGFLLSFLYCVYILIRCSLEPQLGPAVPPEERADIPFLKKTTKLLWALIPPGLLFTAVLGTIFLGIAAPTEAAAVGATAATILTIMYRKFNYKVLSDVCLLTLKVTSFAFLIGAASFAFVGIFLRLGGGDVLGSFLLSTPGGKWGMFIMIQLVVFILGMFLDWLGILFILIPIVSPIVLKVGFDPVWFAIIICVNLQTAFNSPPFAGAVFVVKGTADPELNIAMSDIYRGVIPFIFLILVGLALCIAFPEIITWLPSKMIK